jgi:hypothetical protein
MMVQEYTSTCYVLFWIMVVPTSDLRTCSWNVEHVTSFADIRGRRTGCDFLDLGDGVGLSPSLGTRGGLCRM